MDHDVTAPKGQRILPSIPAAAAASSPDREVQAGAAGHACTEAPMDDHIREPAHTEHASPVNNREAQFDEVPALPNPPFRAAANSRVVPSAYAEDLYAPMSDSEAEDGEDAGAAADQDSRFTEMGDNDDPEDGGYRLGFQLPQTDRGARLMPADPAGAGVPVDALPGNFGSSSLAGRERHGRIGSNACVDVMNGATREGQSSTSAIVIQDSPTPPLRPLASPQARLAATANGRCGVPPDEAERAQDENEVNASIGELVCPICLGAPTPLVVTECGHTFCGPCLHSAITNQAITPQLLQEIPTVAGKDLEGTCPVCRHALKGGWGRSLRGAILRMAQVEVSIPTTVT